MEWGQPTNGSAARQHSSQSHGFAVRVWSNLCICSPGVVKLVKTNLAPDFPLFHDFTLHRRTLLTCLPAGGGRRGPVPPTHTQRKELSARKSLKTMSVNMMCQDVTSCNVFKNICNVLKIFDAFEIKTRPR